MSQNLTIFRTLALAFLLAPIFTRAAEPIPAQPWEKALDAKADGKAAEKPEEKKRRAEGIQDNSFLVEEAYNQEPGVIQHIFTFVYQVDKQRGPDDRALVANFTQEWPLLSQTHQLSYSLLYNSVE